jgi:signal transduction histidine kinase
VRRVHAAWQRLSRRFTAVSVRTKILGMTAGLVMAVGGAATVLLHTELERGLSAELRSRGLALARELASRSEDLILTDRRFELFDLLRGAVASNLDVRYAFVTDARGRPVAHSFERGVPPDLLRVRSSSPGPSAQVVALATDEGPVADVAAPILGGALGTLRVGLSERRIHHVVARATWRALGVTALALAATLGLALFLTAVLTRPLLALVAAARAVGRGDLDVQAERAADDEVGELAEAFDAMVAGLRRSREELMYRVRELGALTAAAAIASHRGGVAEMLQALLGKVLEVMEARAGWVFLRDASGERLDLVAQVGLPPGLALAEAACAREGCACLEVMRSGRAAIVRDLATRCGRASAGGPGVEGVGCHVSVPLVARDRVIGVLNVGCRASRRFTQEELSLLESVGRQVALAVENRQLWEEVRRKDTLRGQLLSQVLAAQEAERKRIARELHDEAGQVLTALLVRLRALEADAALAPALAPRVADLRQLAKHLFDEVHRLAVELRPGALDQLGLVGALESMVREFGARAGVRAEFEASGLDGARLSGEVEIAVYRVVQEALSNVARHAAASRVAVAVERRDGTLVAIVEDDGRGFDPDRALADAPPGRPCLGLFGMQERIALVHGRLTIESAPGSGTTVFAEVPLDA